MEIISILSLLVVDLLCLAGVFSRRYQPTLLQMVGMMMIALWGASELYRGYHSLPEIAMHASLAMYAMGTALRHLKRHSDWPCWKLLTRTWTVIDRRAAHHTFLRGR
jgi:hypothetical protein